jgi:endonuclease YncB( thermonuclease family)
MLEPVTASRGAGSRAGDDPMVEQPFPTRLVHAAEVLRVIDGDTFEARVHLWPGLDVTTRVRLRGIDAPELRAQCDEERVQAETARGALRTILGQGEVRIAHVTMDKYYGRVIADVFTRETPNVSAALIESGAARRYSGGRRNGWCR